MPEPQPPFPGDAQMPLVVVFDLSVPEEFGSITRAAEDLRDRIRSVLDVRHGEIHLFIREAAVGMMEHVTSWTEEVDIADALRAAEAERVKTLGGQT